MKLQRYLNEKFYTGFNQWGKTIEVFENPNSREIKEIKTASKNTIRFFANMKTKQVWMWNGNIATHSNATDGGVKPTSGFKYDDYVFSGGHADIIFGGTLEGDKVLSDSWDASETAQYNTPDLAKQYNDKTYNNILKMQKQDKTWLNKYGINGKEVQRIVDSLVVYFNDELGYGDKEEHYSMKWK